MTTDQPPPSPHWLDAYIAYADARSPMTPRTFHEAIGLWLISTTIARRLVLPMPHDDLYPNLWVLLVARSTLYAKTTAFNLARRIAHRAIPHLLLPDTITPEAILASLGGQAPDDQDEDAQSAARSPAPSPAGQKGQIVDEIAFLLAQAGRDRAANPLELYQRLYDCPPEFERVTRGPGGVKITAAYFTLLAASSPAMLSPYLNSVRLWATGWWSRFALLLPPQSDSYSSTHSSTHSLTHSLARQPYREAVCADEASEHALAIALDHLHRRLPRPVPSDPPRARSVNIAPDVLQAYRAFDKAMRYDVQTGDLPEPLGATYGRIPAQALKVAMCLGAMDWLDGDIAPWVVLEHWQRAEAIARGWAEGAQRLLLLADTQADCDRLARVSRAITTAGDWITLRELCRITHLKASQIENTLADLADAGHIETREVVNGNRTTMQARPCVDLSQPA